MRKTYKNSGFSLVEISIVIVIIGLLIGGLVVTNTMIRSAAVSKFITQLQKLDNSVAAFNAKYGTFAGDTPHMVPPGNGDGFIRSSTHPPVFNSEIANFWVHMQNGGFPYPRKFSTTLPAAGLHLDTIAPNTPSIEVERTSSIIAQNNNQIDKNYWFFAAMHKSPSNLSTTLNTGINQAVASPIFLYTLDSKIDDGKSYHGVVRAMDLVGEPISTFVSGCSDDSTNYNTTSAITCFFMVEMLSQVKNR